VGRHSGRALDFRQQVDDFVAKTRDIRPFELSQEDWEAIKLVAQWLKAFRSATTQMSITKRSMLSSTHTIFRGLQESLRTSLRNIPPTAPSRLKRTLVNAHKKLSDYYSVFDESPFCLWASCEF
jgi:predicted DNA-binding protein (UPF0251 family)